MASAISHVYTAQKYHQLFLSDKDINLHHYYLGNLFPDIRYLGTISRQDSHRGEITHQRVLSATDDFERGRLLHCLVDLRREALVHELHIPDLIPDHPMVPGVLKFIEDDLNYPLVSDWQTCWNYLDQPPIKSELDLVPLDTAVRWHQLLREYMSHPPTIDSALVFASSITLTSQQISQANDFAHILTTNQELRNRLTMVYVRLFDNLN
jgi:hypothetical protein